MRIIFRIIIILVIAGLIAGGFYLAFGGGTLGNAQTSRGFGERGDRGGSAGAGLFGILSNLLELSAIVGLVLFVQNALKYMNDNKPVTSQE